MTATIRARSALALSLLAGSSILGCGNEAPPAPATPAAPPPATSPGPPSGAAADAAAAKSAK